MFKLSALGLSLICFLSAAILPQIPTNDVYVFEVKEKLSDYGLFNGQIELQIPEKDVIPYKLNTALFSDYSEKLRFVRFPEGAEVAYNPDEVLDFPIGTVIIKTFYYPNDFRDVKKGRRLMETRLLIRESTEWKALTYIWDDVQKEAFLEVAGDTKEVTWINANGKKQTLAYSVPNINQCKGCHNNNETLMPIGPSARQLNGDFDYASGKMNQLQYWQKLGILKNLPEMAEVPKTAVWNDPSTGNLDARARAWLDINCAHCHRSVGPAKTSGLLLDWKETDPAKLGIFKTPVAAGKGSGGLKFGIVPQKPEESILLYRMDNINPGEMMPELGRKMNHTEGVALIREWIKNME